MKKKNMLILAVTVSLAAAVGIGATAAYFTDSTQVGNVVTMGKVDISLKETDPESEELTEEGLTFTDVIPGSTLAKDPTVTIEQGSADAYIRMKMELETEEESTIAKEDLEELKTELISQITANQDWYYDAVNEYFYYAKVQSEGDTAALFTSVSIPTSWKNRTANQTFTISLSAEAIQADYFTPEYNDAGQIIRWGTEYDSTVVDSL